MRNSYAGLFCLLVTSVASSAVPLPVRGIHVMAPRPDELDLVLRFIREALPKEGVNTLVLEINYHYRFASHPEVVDDAALTKEDLLKLADAAREKGIQLIPMINCLGHQSWAMTTFGLLRGHPEFDETPGQFAGNEGIYCRSYCPLHPKLHEVLFDLIDELAGVTGAQAFHIGMDEVFLIGEDSCPRCKGKNKAELFAGEVKALRDHLAQKGITAWVWGDRFLDGETTGIGKWEASTNQTSDAVRLAPKDIVICDWHYERALPTPAWFALNGFSVVASPWRRPRAALGQYEQMRQVRANATEPVAARMMGMLQTTWTSFADVAKAYFGDGTATRNAVEVVQTFRELFAALRAE